MSFTFKNRYYLNIKDDMLVVSCLNCMKLSENNNLDIKIKIVYTYLDFKIKCQEATYEYNQ